MSREIKFRIWLVDHRKWDNELVIDPSNGKLLYEGIHDGLRELKENAELMQYTGLKDKNGKEIYEGDIVKVGKKLRGHNKPDEYRNRAIRWSSWRGCWTFDEEQRDIDQSVVWEAAIYDDLEVIGNIYENPELLK